MKVGRLRRYPPDVEIPEDGALPLVMFYSFGERDYDNATLVAHFTPTSLESAMLSVQRCQEIEEAIICPICKTLRRVTMNKEDPRERLFLMHCVKCDHCDHHFLPESLLNMYRRNN